MLSKDYVWPSTGDNPSVIQYTTLQFQSQHSVYLVSQEIALWTTISVCFYWYVCAVPGSRDAREHALGNAIKVFRNQANPDVKQVSVRRSLRSRRDHDIFSNPCGSRVETLQVAGGLAVNVHVCLITSNIGCQPVNGKFLCEKIKSLVCLYFWLQMRKSHD